jgi:cytochrome c1
MFLNNHIFAYNRKIIVFLAGKTIIMKLIKIAFFIALSTIVIAACKSKKAPIAAAATQTEPSTALPPAAPKSINGIYAPGQEELTAIQQKYPETSMQTLTDGYSLYIGVCTNCHPAKNIYTRSNQEWTHIIYDMARKSKMTGVQEDAVSKYVMAIKATQPD